MRIYGDNIISDTTLTASSVKAGYDVDNLKIAQLGKRFSFDGNSGTILIGLIVSTNIKHCIIDIGNMSSSATVTLEGNSTNVWTSPPYTKSLTYTESSFYADINETYQFWRLSIEDTTKTSVELGYISIGGAYTQMPMIDYKAEIFYKTTAQNSISIGGQIYGDDGYEYLETTFKFPQIEEASTTFNGVTVANRKEIKALYLELKNITPFWVMLWAENLDEYAPVFCIFNQNKISFMKTDYTKVYSTKLSLREVL